MKYLLLLVWIGLGAFAQAADKELLQWCRYDLPPIQITDGPEAGHGVTDGVITFLQKAMPEYEHREIHANIRRINELLRNGEHLLCPGTGYSPDREAIMVFSIPYTVSRPATALIAKASLPQFKPYLNRKGELQLERILTQSPLVLGIASGRSYGKEVDATLAKLMPRPNIAIRPASNDIMQALAQMMLLGRVDYTLIFPVEMKYVLQQIGKPDAALLLSIEGNNSYGTVHVAAPKNEWGQEKLARINEILRQNRNNPALFHWTYYWYDDDTLAWWQRAMKDLQNRKK